MALIPSFDPSDTSPLRVWGGGRDSKCYIFSICSTFIPRWLVRFGSVRLSSDSIHFHALSNNQNMAELAPAAILCACRSVSPVSNLNIPFCFKAVSYITSLRSRPMATSFRGHNCPMHIPAPSGCPSHRMEHTSGSTIRTFKLDCPALFEV